MKRKSEMRKRKGIKRNVIKNPFYNPQGLNRNEEKRRGEERREREKERLYCMMIAN